MYAKSTFAVALLAATAANAIPTKPVAAHDGHETSHEVEYSHAPEESTSWGDHEGHEVEYSHEPEESTSWEDYEGDEVEYSHPPKESTAWEDDEGYEAVEDEHKVPDEHEQADEEEWHPEPSYVEHAEDSTSTFAVDPEQVTQTVAVGRGGALTFEPNNIVADVGTIVEFHFGPENHGVAQASFDDPCQPLIDDKTHEQLGFFSGFNFAVEEGQAEKVFQYEVTDKDTPVWFYCPQAEHCSAGMVGVINQDPDSENNIRAFTEEAAERDNVVPDEEQGGLVVKNPNPDSGF